MRVYSLPHFNIGANVWFGVLPDDLTTWDGLVPSSPPDVETECQLYYPRWGLNRWLHALAESCVKSLLNAGVQELRYPTDVDLQAPWGVSNVTKWSEVPLCEVPSGSGRLYAVCLQEKKHAGFPNEYAVSILAQIGAVPPSPPPPPPPVAASLPAGGALRSTIPPARSIALPAGGALGVESTPPAVDVDLPAGAAMAMGPPPPAWLPAGGAMTESTSPTSGPRAWPAGTSVTVAEVNPPVASGRLPAGEALQNQELLPSRVRSLPAGEALSVSNLPPAKSNDLAAGSAMTADVVPVALVNPCASVGVPIRLLCTCTAQTGTLSGWVGQNVTVVYNSGTGVWTGTLTKGGHSGTMTFTGLGAGNFSFAGNSGTDWSVSAPLMGNSVTCGPPFSATQTAGSTTEGINIGTTSWSFQAG